MNSTTIFFKVIETAEEDGKYYKLAFEVRRCVGNHYSAELTDSSADSILCGQWSDTDWNGAPECYYAGGGKYADPDDQYYREDGRDSVRDRILLTPEQFREKSAKLAAREIVDSWYWPDCVSDDAKDEVTELLREYLIERQGEEPEAYAEEQSAEYAERVEGIITEAAACGKEWRVRPDSENAAPWWWDNGGRELWGDFAGKTWAGEVIAPAEKCADFLRAAAKVPGFFPNDISDPERPIYQTPFVISSAQE